MASSEGPGKKRFKYVREGWRIPMQELMESRLDNADTITVLVGPNETKFIIHEDIIKGFSEFFRAACAGGFKEAKEKLVRLPEIQTETFDIYAHWIYTGSFVVMDPDAMSEDKQGQKRMMEAAKVFIAGDVLGDRQLRNAAIDCILKVKDETSLYPETEIVSLAYKETPESSALRRVIIDEYLCQDKQNATWFKAHANEFPKQFLVDIVHGRLLNSHIRPSKPRFADRCKYHEHDDSLPKCSKS